MFLGAYRQCAIFLIVIAVVLAGCTGSDTPVAEGTATDATSPTNVAAAPEVSDVTAGLPQLEGKAKVEIVVNGSTITVEVDGDQAPLTAGNFIDLVERGVYEGTVFHRVVREPQPFVVQGGDPQSKDPAVPVERLGTGSFNDPETNQPRYIPLEITPSGAGQPLYNRTFEMAGVAGAPALSHTRGAIAMARSQFPDSASAQFYFTLTDLPFLDGNYAVFGYITDGLEVIDSIQQGDVIESAKVIEGIENFKPADVPGADEATIDDSDAGSGDANVGDSDPTDTEESSE